MPEKLHGRFGIVFGMQEDVSISAQESLPEQFLFAGAVVDQ